MHCTRKVTDHIYWVGGSDRRLALFENNGSLFDLEAEDCRMCPESFRNFVAVRTVKMTAGYPRDAYVKVGKNGKIKLGFYENSKIEIKI